MGLVIPWGSVATWSLRAAWFVILAALVGATISHANRPVTRISLDGVMGPGEVNALGALVRQHSSAGILLTDLDDLVADLEARSWVRQATVRRRWPDALEVSVRTRVPVARWGTDRYLSADGQVVTAVDPSAHERLPVLLGSAGDEPAMMERFRLIARLLRPLGLGVSRLEFDERQRWSLQLSNGVEVRFGAGDVNMRVRRFIDLYKNRLHERAAFIESIDVRYADGIAVAWRTDEEFEVTQR